MKMKYIAGAIVFLALVAVGWALVPPPPADQKLGIYDTTVANFNETLCRDCHGSSPALADRHHMLVQNGAIPGCQSCHPVIAGGGIIIDRNCIACHNGSAFYANLALPAQKPHHNTTQAQNRSCEFCHGSFIDNWADGHYVPTYAMSLVTPDTKYKVVNATTGKKWGGCEACHEPSAIGPGVPLVIVRNQDTHHNEVVGVTGGPTGPSCLWCHNTTAGAVNIRSCEQCHGVKSLHNIQYDYANTTGTLGHGHIGANWDCNGCHAWYVAGQDGPVGPLVPDISSVSTNDFISGQTTVFTINGNNFVNTVNGVTYTSTVKIVSETGVVTTLTPTTISASQIKVTVPSLSVGTYALYVSKDGGASGQLKSKEVPITVSSKVTITSAKLSSGTITITGTGFGPKPATNAQQYVTIVHAGKTYYSDSISSWSNTQIKAKSSVARSGDTVTVTRADGSGQASKVITR